MIIEEKEQLIRIVSQVGNGAHIFAPKEWINERVLLVRLEKKTIKEQVLEKLYPFLDKVTAVFLYGSHARKEATEFSDIDVLVIAKEKFKLEKENGKSFIILQEEEIPEAIKINPILMYSIFKEAVTIINPSYLDKFREIKVEKSNFKQFIKQTKESIVSSREIVELDKKTGKYSSDSILYSAILRLRGIFIINCLLKNTPFSNSTFKEWLKNLEINYSEIYEIYRRVRDDKPKKNINIPIWQEEKLINFLEQELDKLK
jgi:predicted nucleotidyltransferase